MCMEGGVQWVWVCGGGVNWGVGVCVKGGGGGGVNGVWVGGGGVNGVWRGPGGGWEESLTEEMQQKLLKTCYLQYQTYTHSLSPHLSHTRPFSHT